MSFIVEFETDSPILRETARAVPDMAFRMEDLHLPDGTLAKFIFWADGDDYETMEAALETDPTVEDHSLLTQTDGNRLYRVTFSDEATEFMTYPDAADYDITYLTMTGTHRGYRIRARVPSRAALKAFRNAVEEKGLPFRLERLYHEEDDAEQRERFGLTDAQYEALRVAYERGYYCSPRETLMEEIAEELGISRQAVGSRLRRGYEQLLASALFQKPP